MTLSAEAIKLYAELLIVLGEKERECAVSTTAKKIGSSLDRSQSPSLERRDATGRVKITSVTAAFFSLHIGHTKTLRMKVSVLHQ